MESETERTVSLISVLCGGYNMPSVVYRENVSADKDVPYTVTSVGAPRNNTVGLPGSMLLYFEPAKTVKRIYSCSHGSYGNVDSYAGTQIQRIYFPAGLETIGAGAFRNSTRLDSLIGFEDTKVKRIEFQTFELCGAFATLNLPKDLEYIGTRAFDLSGMSLNNRKLSEIQVYDKLEKIDAEAFKGCVNLGRVDVSDIGNWCGVEFVDTASNPLTFAQNIYHENRPMYRLEIPVGVQEISSLSFYNCKNVKRVVLPSTINVINDNAFGGCSGLTHVIVRAITPPEADYEAFCGVDRNTCRLVVPKGCKEIYDGWCGFKFIVENENTRRYVRRVYVDRLSYAVDEDDENMYSVIYGTDEYPGDGDVSYQSVDDAVLLDSVELDGVNVPVGRIGDRAFFNTGIRSVEIPETIRSIGIEAFSGTGNSLRTVICYGVTPPDCVDDFDTETYRMGTLYVPAGSVDVYRSKSPWNKFINICEIGTAPVPGTKFRFGELNYEVINAGPENATVRVVTTLELPDESYLSSIDISYPELAGADVVVPETVEYGGVVYTVTELGQYAFWQTGLRSIEIPPTVEMFRDGAFTLYQSSDGVEKELVVLRIRDLGAFFQASSEGMAMAYLKDIEFDGVSLSGDVVVPEDVARIGSRILYMCPVEMNLTIPSTVTSIGDAAFSFSRIGRIDIADSDIPLTGNCDNMFTGSLVKEAYIGRDISGTGLFSDCSYLEKVEYGKAVTSVNQGMFERCVGLRSVKYGAGCLSIGDNAFSGCSNYVVTELPLRLQRIGSSAFTGLITEFTALPEGVSYIGNGAFSGGVLNITSLPSALTVINPMVFSGATFSPDTEFVIGANIKEINYNAFSYCRGLTSLIISEGIEDILYAPFMYMSDLQIVSLPSTIKNIYTDAFSGSSNISVVVSKSKIPADSDKPYGYGKIFDDEVYGSARLHVPYGCGSNYVNIAYDDNRVHWKNFTYVMESALAGVSDVVADGSDAIKVRVESGRIVITGMTAEDIAEVYSVAGRLVHRGGHETVRLPKGYSVVKVAGLAVKIKL